MTSKHSAFTAILKRLSSLLDREKDALNGHSFSGLLQLIPEKNSLLAEYDVLEQSLGETDDLEELTEALQALKVKAAENADRMKTMSESVKKARGRIAALADAERQFGAYNPDGAPMRVTKTSTVVTSA